MTACLSCRNETEKQKMKFLVNEIPSSNPIDFRIDLIPESKLIHKGVFTPDLNEYYYTISDPNFSQFDVFVIKKQQGKWAESKKAFFNSKYSEHGMSFSPDGKSLYFSSTRPTNIVGIPTTWHIWKSEKVDGEWSAPEFIDIPNFRDKLLSHPSVSSSGKIYFHKSNLDYSDMDIYYSEQVNGEFGNAKKIAISGNIETAKCTPFISADEDFLIFASIEEQLDLMISFSDGMGGWKNTRKLNKEINNMGQGNPYVTPDNKFLFFATGEQGEKNWSVKWVNIAAELKRD